MKTYRLNYSWRKRTFELQEKEHYSKNWYCIDLFTDMNEAVEELRSRQQDATIRADDL